MAMLHPGTTGNRTLSEMLQRLRSEEQAEALAQPYLPEMVATTAKWAWTLENDHGEFVASMAIMPDVNRRGWFVSYPGTAAERAPNDPKPVTPPRPAWMTAEGDSHDRTTPE